jgi:hypothetical protein
MEKIFTKNSLHFDHVPTGAELVVLLGDFNHSQTITVRAGAQYAQGCPRPARAEIHGSLFAGAWHSAAQKQSVVGRLLAHTGYVGSIDLAASCRWY